MCVQRYCHMLLPNSLISHLESRGAISKWPGGNRLLSTCPQPDNLQSNSLSYQELISCMAGKTCCQADFSKSFPSVRRGRHE